MNIRKLTTVATSAILGVALTAGVAAAAEPWNALDGVSAAPLTADQMDAVQGKTAGSLFMSLVSQDLVSFATFDGVLVGASVFEGQPGEAGFVLFPENDSVNFVNFGTQ